MNRNDYNILAYQFTKLEGGSYKDSCIILEGLMTMLQANDPSFDKRRFLAKVNNLTEKGKLK